MLRWLRWYLLIFAVLLCAALVKRHIELKGLCKQITNDIEPLAQNGSDDFELLERYFYGSHTSPLSGNFQWIGGSDQGPAIFLLKRGYMDDRLARAVLLTEARRLNDWQYTYAFVYNYDLRTYLIQRCLRVYPDDLAVAWAAGSLSLAAGDEDIALEQLGRIIAKPEQWPECVGLCKQLGVKPEHMLGRYAATLTLLGRDSEADKLLFALHGADADAEHCYLRYLSDCARYEELLALATSPSMPYTPMQSELYGWMYNAALHNKDWLRVRTTAREKTRLWLRDVQRSGYGDYELDYNPYWKEAAAVAYLYELGPQFIATSKIDYSAIDEGFTNYVKVDKSWLPYLLNVLDLESVEAPLATLYGETGDERWLKPLEDNWPRRVDEDTSVRHSDVGAQLLRAYILRNEYDKAYRVLKSINDPYGVDPKASAPLLLYYIANESIPRTQLSHWGESTSDERSWLNAVREGDTLVAVLRSPQFAAALKHSGRKLVDVMPEIRAATLPQRDAYYDYANGTLDRIRRQLGLPKP